MASGDTTTMAGADFEFSLDCESGAPATWTRSDCDVVGVAVGGGARPVGQLKVLCGDVLINVGEQDAYTPSITMIYKEGASDAYKLILDQFLGASQEFGIRYAPAGNVTGNLRYTICGCLTDVPLPQGTAEDGTPIQSVILMEGTLTLDTVP